MATSRTSTLCFNNGVDFLVGISAISIMQVMPSILQEPRATGKWESRQVLHGRMVTHVHRVRTAPHRVDTDTPPGWQPRGGEPYHSASEARRRQQRRYDSLRISAMTHPTGVAYDIDPRAHTPPRPASAGVVRSRLLIHAPRESTVNRGTPSTTGPVEGTISSSKSADPTETVVFKEFVLMLSRLDEKQRESVLKVAELQSYEARLLRQFGQGKQSR
jgi:hypothetical protein